MIKHKHQRGFLLIAAIVLVAFLSFYGVVLTRMSASTTQAATGYTAAANSYYIANAGLHYGTKMLLNNDFTYRSACSSFTSTQSLGTGEFSVATKAGSPISHSSTFTLSASINASVTVIPTNSISGLPTLGRVRIDRESINYTGTSSLSADCSGNPPCLTGAIRGADSTAASTHVNGAQLTQYLCELQSTGSVPDTSTVSGETTLEHTVQLQEAWAVGNNNGNNLSFAHFNRPTEKTWTNKEQSVGGSLKTILNSVSMLDYMQAWAVGDKADNKFSIRKYDPSTDTWVVPAGLPTPTPASRYVKNLYGVSAVTGNDIWVVGEASSSGGGSSKRYTIIHWDGTTWCKLDPAGSCGGITIPADNNTNTKDLRSVSVIDTTGNGIGNLGFAVGANGRMLKFNGSAWTVDTTVRNKTLRSVFVLSSSEAWAVGDDNTVLKWNGSTWTQLLNATTGIGNTDDLNGVYAIDTTNDGAANIVWIVGKNAASGRAFKFDGSTWSTHNPTGTANKKLNGVAIYRPNDVWAIGNSGRFDHWNGSSWVYFQSGSEATLNSVSLVGPNSKPSMGFKTIYN